MTEKAQTIPIQFPDDLAKALKKAAKKNKRSFNAEVIDLLQVMIQFDVTAMSEKVAKLQKELATLSHTYTKHQKKVESKLTLLDEKLGLKKETVH